ncbi:N-terminal acetyltransferase A complex catalytic subunit ard1 [Astathelohania contejeani]|uniref:N-terminal acetyltransferase A complex catalytic subunit ard1 n=1 Tax=Astathelohania contejeani TaxID=164912 RepID=A0ABQ7HYW2_9MICR|nr:N-terminal acetyltransferase A complex catalytic subunit ard1 [Thelohania contejeani]
MFSIRKAKYCDLYHIQKINTENLPENYTMAYYLYHRMQYPNINFVATVENKIVGYVLCKLEINEKIYEGNITSICINSEYKGQGIGTRLMKEALQEMKYVSGQDDLTVYLNVRVTNTPAIEFYKKKFKFEIVKLIEKYYFNKEDAYRMKTNVK